MKQTTLVLATAIDGMPISNRTEIRSLLDVSYRVGDRVEVSIVKPDRERTVGVALQEEPQ